MKDSLGVVRERNVGEIGGRQAGTCPEGYCEKTLRLEKELTRWKREEAVLRDIERRYLALLDSPLLILLILSEGRVLFMNRRGEEFFGFALRERPRFLLSEYAASGYASSVESLFTPGSDGAVRGGRLDFAVRSESGRERRIDCAFVPGVYQGAPVLLGAGYELPEGGEEGSETDSVDVLLSEREDLLFCSMDTEYVPTFMTEGFRNASVRIWGRSPDQNEALLKILPSGEHGESFRLAAERAHAGEYAETAFEAGELVYSCSFAPLYSKEGEPLGISLLLTDRTELCRLERERYAEAESFQRLFASSGEMMLIASVEDGKLLRGSPAFLSWMGYEETAILGRTESDFALYADALQRERLVNELEENGSVEDFEVEMRTASGDLVPGRASVSRILHAGRDSLLYVFHETVAEPKEEEPVATSEDADVVEEQESMSEAIQEIPGAEEKESVAAFPVDGFDGFELPEPPEGEPQTLIDSSLLPKEGVQDARLRSMLAQNEDTMLCILDEECVPIIMTKGFEHVCETLWGRLPAEGEALHNLLPAGVQGEAFRVAVERARNGERSKTGQEAGDRYFSLSFSPVDDSEGRFSAISLAATDLTESRARERECRAHADNFRRLFSSSPEMLLISSVKEGRVLSCNRAFLSRMGFAETSVLGRTEEELGIYNGAGQRERLVKELDDAASVENYEVQLKSSSGDVFPGRVSVERIESEGAAALLSLFRDITNEKQAEECKQAATDMLSGIPSRSGFERILNTEIDRAMRYRGNMSLILIDVDGFGALNETLGREAGDRVLKDFCAAVKSRIRPTDFIGRWGGDEFAVLTPMSGRIAFQIAEAIRDMIYNYRFLPDRILSSSMGVAEFRRSMDMNEFVKRAEDALAEAKKAGGNKAVLAPFVP